MALTKFLKHSVQANKEITEDTVRQDLPDLQNLIAYWRLYPDKFIDFLCSQNPRNTFQFFFYQRVYLRAAIRFKYVFCTFPRGWSKSFLAVLCLMIKCILYPGCRIFVASGGKGQSASILQQKVTEIIKLIPALEKEINWEVRGVKAKTQKTKDSVSFVFNNGSVLENVVASEHTRGQRYQSGLLEEAVGIDSQMLNDVLIPTLNISRKINGKEDPNELLNQSQIYINIVSLSCER